MARNKAGKQEICTITGPSQFGLQLQKFLLVDKDTENKHYNSYRPQQFFFNFKGGLHVCLLAVCSYKFHMYYNLIIKKQTTNIKHNFLIGF